MILAPFFGLKASTSSARPTGSPRIWSATSRPFWADRRTPRRIAVVSMSCSLLLRRWRRRRRNLLVGGVALEGAGEGELAELVPDHVLGHVHRNMLLAVVHGDRQPDEIGRDGRAPRPGLDRTLVRRCPRRLHLRLQVMVDERSLLDRTSHGSLSLFRGLAAANDHAVGALVAARLITLARRAPGRHRMVSPAAAVCASAHRMVDRIHRDAAHRRADAAPAVGARLADRAQAMFLVAD